MGRSEQRPEAVVQLGGQERTLRFDVVVLEDIEEEIGLNLLDLSGTKEEVMSSLTQPKVISALVWAMLLHAEPDLKRRDVGRWLHGEALLAVPSAAAGLALKELMAASATEEASEEPDPPQASPAAE
ncbi:hypothetical protein [Gaopeijia maritima]|uniref:hypothetical protein n=1 Tax=Gaopeijia maritima TaxID=3119007 RepID=UPI0032952FA3